LAASDLVVDLIAHEFNLLALMHAELGIHPDNGKRLLAAGYVTLDGEPLTAERLPCESGRNKTLAVLGRQTRLEAPTKYLPDQGELF
jgi:hypothetical protein